MKKLIIIFSVLALLLLSNLLLIAPASARGGGGHGSSGGGHSSGGHSSGGGFFSGHSSSNHYYSGNNATNNAPARELSHDETLLLVTIIVFVLIMGLIIYYYQTKDPNEIIIHNRPSARITQAQLNNFKTKDPNFSRIVFLDFVHLLYVKYYHYYGKKDFSYLIPYLAENVRHDAKLDLLISQQVIVISEVVINSVRLYSLITSNHEDQIGVEIQANYTVHPAFYSPQSGKQYTRYVLTERWVFYRQSNIVSLPPEKMQVLTCPSCGALAHFSDVGECNNCGAFIIQGEKQWSVKERYVIKQNVIEMNSLAAYANEQGTNFATLFSPTLQDEMNNFSLKQHCEWSEYWRQFKENIVKNYCLEFNKAWTKRDLTTIRHLFSDRLYEAQSFWISLYNKQEWTNQVDDLIISNIELVKIETDYYYEAITVRLFASCFDYTVDKENNLIGGFKKKRRPYSEYWTFARRTGVETNISTFNIHSCPQCAAPADNIGQSGECAYCGAKISTGEFSWVLFLITQDENYSD